jgi:hypothetical protein
LEKVLEALGMDQNTVDTCITGVASQSADMWYTHASLRMKQEKGHPGNAVNGTIEKDLYKQAI